jgi:hypothetical protein
MMYQNKLAVAIKHNGKILRETKDIVHLPFGSEFSVLVKNLNSKRVKFTLHIDGTDALDGEEIVVNANSETEIKRFIRNGNMDEGNAFKFIERTAAIEDGPRGIKVDDSVVRVEFWFEQDKPEIKVKDIYWEKHHYRDYYQQPLINHWNGPFYGSTNIAGNASAGGSLLGGVDHFATGSIARGAVLSNVSQTNASFSATSASATLSDEAGGGASINSIIADAIGVAPEPKNDAGITVPGSKVEQKFTTVYGFKSEANSNTIILRLVGVVGEVEVTKPITVAHKPECVTCGKLNKANSKFCSECGTALTLI